MSSKNKAIEGDGYNKLPRATEDDVEGHTMVRAVEPDGHNKAPKAVEGDDFVSKRVTEGDDVEGHQLLRKAVEGDDFVSKRVTEDDVEGHNIGVMNPILARELSRARERDVQREASRNSLIGEAKRALGRKR